MQNNTVKKNKDLGDSDFSLSEEGFVSTAENFDLIPMACRVSGDDETPLTVWRKIRADSLLETVEHQGCQGRFSLVGRGQVFAVSVREEIVRFEAADKADFREEKADRPWLKIREHIQNLRVFVPKSIPPVFLSMIGFVGYEASSWFERMPSVERKGDIPDARLVLPEILVGCDAFDRTLWLITWVFTGKDNKEAYRQGMNRLIQIKAALGRVVEKESIEEKIRPSSVSGISSSKDEYVEKVKSLKGYIIAGELVQGVLARHIEVKNPPPPMTVYRRLRVQNPSPYHFYLDYGNFCLVGASPEMLVKGNEGQLTIRPIAGTRPRGKDERSDTVFEEDLLADEKEKAEHLMLVDLARNDIGRVAVSGSVRVAEFMKVERYSQVMHLVSTVSGRLRRDKGFFDVLAATFPAGTLTGAPKIRAMEIIRELENHPRGPYGGAVLRIGFGGDFDSCITIRTVVFEGDRAGVSAGAGIVHLSKPESEFEECQNKAKASLKALGIEMDGDENGTLDR